MKLEAFKKMVDMGFKKTTVKTMKIGDYENLDEALDIWFRQQRELNIPVSCAQGMLYEQLYPNATKTFTASTGFQWRFSKRHGLKNLAEQASSDIISACDFQFHFSFVIEGYSPHHIFNCDEKYRLLPRKILASLFEKRAEGVKKAKERVTINARANITGSNKLSLLFIGKSAHP